MKHWIFQHSESMILNYIQKWLSEMAWRSVAKAFAESKIGQALALASQAFILTSQIAQHQATMWQQLFCGS